MQRVCGNKKPKHTGNLWINIHLANPAQYLSILCILKGIHLQPVLVGDIPALCPLTKFAKIAAENVLSFSLLRKASILRSASQCRVKQNPPEQRLAQRHAHYHPSRLISTDSSVWMNGPCMQWLCNTHPHRPPRISISASILSDWAASQMNAARLLELSAQSDTHF